MTINQDYYRTPVKRIYDLDPYLKRKNNKIYVTCNKLEVRVSKRFQTYGLLDITNKVHTLGIMDLIIDDKYEMPLNILARVIINPTDTTDIVIDGIDYLCMFLYKGDVFIENTHVPQEDDIIFATYKDFIANAKIPYWYTYDGVGVMYDKVKKMTGSDLGVDNVLLELIESHISRDPQNLHKLYRYTDMKTPPKFISIRDVFYAPTNTSTRIMGSYSEKGTTSALQTQTKDPQPFENIYRGIPEGI